MTLEPTRDNTPVKDWQRKYQRERARNITKLFITPTKTKLLKEYYEEYVMAAQQDLYIPVDFHEFIIQFAEIGFLAWRAKNRGK